MKGIDVRKKLQNNGFSLKLVAEAMGETPQNLNSMLQAQDIKTGVLEKIAKAINKNLYFFFEEKVELMTEEEMAQHDKEVAEGKRNTTGILDSNKTMTTDERIDALIRQNDGLIDANSKLAQSVQDAIKVTHETIAANQRQSETNQEIMKQLLSMLESSKKHVRVGRAQFVAEAAHV